MTIHDFFILINSKIIPILISIIGFGILIVIHELGHFLFCKAFGIYTPTFSIGFGPKIIERKIGTTNFRLSQIPFGGYVEIAGLAEVGQGDQEFAKATGNSSFSNKYYWQKFLVLCGGIIFNFLLAYVIFCALFLIGDSSQKEGIAITHTVKGSASEVYGLHEGDLVLAINNRSLISKENTMTPQDILLEEIRNHPNQEVTFLLEREETKITLPIILTSKQENEKAIGSLGAGFAAVSPIKKLPFLQAINAGITVTNKYIYDIALGIKNLFTKRNFESAGGPVMIIAHGVKTAQRGLTHFLIFLATMSITLALFNLLPLGITDGGQLLFATIEAIIRRPTPEWLRVGVNLISFALFALLFAYLTYKDISNLFGSSLASLYHKIIGIFSK
jgi:regulator of sigma E protease